MTFCTRNRCAAGRTQQRVSVFLLKAAAAYRVSLQRRFRSGLRSRLASRRLRHIVRILSPLLEGLVETPRYLLSGFIDVLGNLPCGVVEVLGRLLRDFVKGLADSVGRLLDAAEEAVDGPRDLLVQ